MAAFKETIVIAVGGSLLVPEQVDVDFLHRLKELVSHFTREGYQLALVIGGGKTSRTYHNAARTFPHVSNDDLDWIGIKTIALNCELLKRVFGDLDLHQEIIFDSHTLTNTIPSSVILVGASEPGHSSDYNAVVVAKNIGARQVINFSNITHVYTADPRVDANAVPLDTISWDEYRTLIPTEWISNMSAPFDPIASREAQTLGLTVAVLGSSIDNLQQYLKRESFIGTTITP